MTWKVYSTMMGIRVTVRSGFRQAPRSANNQRSKTMGKSLSVPAENSLGQKHSCLRAKLSHDSKKLVKTFPPLFSHYIYAHAYVYVFLGWENSYFLRIIKTLRIPTIVIRDQFLHVSD